MWEYMYRMYFWSPFVTCYLNCYIFDHPERLWNLARAVLEYIILQRNPNFLIFICKVKPTWAVQRAAGNSDICVLPIYIKFMHPLWFLERIQYTRFTVNLYKDYVCTCTHVFVDLSVKIFTVNKSHFTRHT